MMRYSLVFSFFVLAGILVVGSGCDRHESWKTESGLEVIEVVVGRGNIPKNGDVVSIEFTASYLDGDVFDSTERTGQPRKFRIGKEETLPGFDEGIATMRKGGKRILIVPPHLAFGEEGRPGVVPPNAWVRVEVELVDIQMAPPTPLPWNDAGMEFTTTASGLQFIDFTIGEGEFPELGSIVVVHYSGYLEDGTLFDTTYQRGHPVEFEVNMKTLIRGWIEGLLTMRAGGSRKLIVPPFLGYGEKGYGKQVPPNATLIYDIELLDIH